MILARGIAVAIAIIVACLIALGLASEFLVDWAWFSSVGFFGVFWTIISAKSALFAAGLKTVGEVREMSDEDLLRLPDVGKGAVIQLRRMLGLPSTDGVRPGVPKK